MADGQNVDHALSAIRKYADAKRALRELRIIRSERVMGEIGEWYFINLFGGELASRTSEKGWDVLIEGRMIQVKAHAKSDHNSARWSQISAKRPLPFDELYVLVFTQNLVLSEIFRQEAGLLPVGTFVHWDRLKPVDLDEAGKPEFLAKLYENCAIVLGSR